MSNEVLNELKSDLKECETLSEIFNAVEELYDTDAELGFLAKTAIINKLPTIIKVAGLQPHEDGDEEE